MKINALERSLVEAFSNKFQSRATGLQCTQMSASVTSQSGSNNNEVGAQTTWCVAQEFLMSLFLAFSMVTLKSARAVNGSSGTDDITDPLQNGTKDMMFGHPVRDALDSAAISQRFLSENTNCHVVSLYGPLTQFVSHKNVAVKIACFRHGHVDERSVNLG